MFERAVFSLLANDYIQVIFCAVSYVGGVFAIREIRQQSAPVMMPKAVGALLWCISPIWFPFWFVGRLLFWGQ